MNRDTGMKRDIDVCIGCRQFMLYEAEGNGPYPIIPPDKPSCGAHRYFYCNIEGRFDSPVRLERSLVAIDGKARRKYERRRVPHRCERWTEQCISAWNMQEKK